LSTRRRIERLNSICPLVVNIASGEVEDTVSESKRHPSQRGRAGGIKGGAARAKRLTPQDRIHYNFARIHKTLRITPAMAAGLSDHVWSYEDIAALAD
jgi:hypothetical protein